MNIGYSTRLPYDECAYKDKLKESTGPIEYRLLPDQMYNCNSCLYASGTGPRAANNGRGYDVSRSIKTKYAASQDLVDVESILSNRNVKLSKCKTGKVNPVDVMKFKLMDEPICNNHLDKESTRLSHPSSNYRDMSINRFYNLVRDPQMNIFWDEAVNSRLEAKDNFVQVAVIPWADRMQPKEAPNNNVKCTTSCSNNRCGQPSFV